MAGHWEEARLMACRRPAMADGEVELATTDVDSVDPSAAAAREMAHAASLTLTSHRLVWVSRAATLALALPLSHISSFSESCCGILKNHKKIKLETEAGRVCLRVPCKAHFGEKLSAALAERRWAQPKVRRAPSPQPGCPSSAQAMPRRVPSPHAIGAALATSPSPVPLRRSHVCPMAAPADALHERACELVRAARRAAAAQPQQPAAAARKSVADISRQAAQICACVLEQCGRDMELPDLFGLHSRLHGIEEALPANVLASCEMLEGLTAELQSAKPACDAAAKVHERSF